MILQMHAFQGVSPLDLLFFIHHFIFILYIIQLGSKLNSASISP